jgi:hypothetical protein
MKKYEFKYLSSVDKEELLRCVRIVWKIDEVRGRFGQRQERIRGQLHPVHVANVLVQREFAVDLKLVSKIYLK